MGREILVTGDEILYRDVVAGQPKPGWTKGPSVNLSPLPFPEATTRMQVSGNQYLQLSALQAFFAQAFSDIEHDHDDRYDALGTAAGLVASEASTRSNADNAISQAVTDLTTLVTQINNWKSSLTDADQDNIVNTLTELLSTFNNVPEGTDIYGIITSKLSGSDVVNSLTSILTNVPLSAAMGTQLKGLIDGLTTAFNNHTANHAPANAQANVIEKIKVNGVEQTVTDKAVDLTIKQSSYTTVTLSKTAWNANLRQTKTIAGISGKKIFAFALSDSTNNFTEAAACMTRVVEDLSTGDNLVFQVEVIPDIDLKIKIEIRD